jgi:REP element-mobilizing transposase RayT
MTAPRQILPGKTYLLTRRSSQRRFLLRPSALTNAVFAYVLAVAAQRYGILVHVCVVLSNHFHLVITDPDARLPAFVQYLNSLVARALNASVGDWDSFWDPFGYNAVELATDQDIVDKVAYALANPVAAGLVPNGRDWPGIWTDPELIGRGGITCERPEGFFRENGPMPATAELKLTAPPGFASSDEFRDRVIMAARATEDAARAVRAADRRGFLGAKRVLAQDPAASPKTTEARRNLKPRAAARNAWTRIETLTRLRAFQAAYRAARAALRNGARDVVFPAGTYLLRVSQGVPCLAPA